MQELLLNLYQTTGIAMMTISSLIMIGIALILLYLAIAKGYEPYLLLPLAFGMLWINLPTSIGEGWMNEGG